MITRDNIQDVVNMMTAEDIKKLTSCEYEYVYMDLAVFNVGTVLLVSFSNDYKEFEDGTVCLSIDDAVFSHFFK